MTETWMLVAGLAACFDAVAVAFVAALRAQPRLSKDRRTPPGVVTFWAPQLGARDVVRVRR